MCVVKSCLGESRAGVHGKKCVCVCIVCGVGVIVCVVKFVSVVVCVVRLRVEVCVFAVEGLMLSRSLARSLALARTRARARLLSLSLAPSCILFIDTILVFIYESPREYYVNPLLVKYTYDVMFIINVHVYICIHIYIYM